LRQWRLHPSQALREKLAETGRAGERRMLIATGGVNTHRGAIWTLGLLVASAAMGPRSPEVLAERAGRLARFNDREPPDPTSHGARMGCRFGVSGARGEAKQGFPHVIQLGLPALRAARAKMVMESHARLDALLAIMTDLNDTCLLYRGGLAALEIAKAGAGQVLSLGGTASAAGYSALLALDTKLIRHGVSPGGSADLLAATLFLDFVEHGDHSNLPWKN
jgi:triphosphoribosyl-dephospho-CoA synthase